MPLSNYLPATSGHLSGEERKTLLEGRTAYENKVDWVNSHYNEPGVKRIKDYYLERFSMRYPGLTSLKNKRDIPNFSPEFYTRLPCPQKIRPGDICMNGTYGVEISQLDALKSRIYRQTRKPKEPDLDKIIELVESVDVRVRHCLDYVSEAHRILEWSVDDEHSSIPGSIPFGYDDNIAIHAIFSEFNKKIINLGDVVSKQLPGVCFEKSLILAALLNGDERLNRFGIKSYLTCGELLQNGKYCGAPHAWVRLEVPKRMGKRGFLYQSYVLDPSANMVFYIDNGVKDTEFKYIEGITPTTRKLDLSVYRPIK